MPKMSNASADAIETSVGIQEGNVEIADCVSRIHQFQANKRGEQSAPFSCVAVKLQRLDKDMDPTDDEPEWVYYSLGKDSVDKFHPGNADNADDDEISDEGDEVETEGNTINAINGDKPNKKCKWMLFVAKLEAKGFKSSVLANGYLPDLVGLKGHVSTMAMEKIEGNEKAPSVLIFDSISTFPYSDKAKKGAKSEKSSAKGGKKKDADEDEKPAKGNKSSKKEDKEDDEDEADTTARTVLAAIAEKHSEATMPVKKIVSFAQTEMIKTKVPGALQKQIKEKLLDETWLEEIGKDELELITEIDDGSVTFA